MESAATFFGKFSEITVFAVRWIIYFGRKYPLAAAGYLVFYAWFFFLQAKSNQSNLPLPPPPQQQRPTSFTPSSPISASPIPSPVVPLAQTQAFRNGNSAIIKWSQPVNSPALYADGKLLQASCQPQVCTVSIPAQVNELQATWQEGGQSFKRKFRF